MLKSLAAVLSLASAAGWVTSTRAPARRSLRARAARAALDDDAVATWIGERGLGAVSDKTTLGGSGWASFARYTTEDQRAFFVKTATRSAKEMFEGEALGLMAMYNASESADGDGLTIPRVYGAEDFAGGRGSFICMDYLQLGGRGDQRALGRAVARLHLAPPDAAANPDGLFGFPVDNTIGGTPQPNAWMADWVAFFRERRMDHQVALAGDGALDSLWAKVAPRLGELFDDVQRAAGPIAPSILHGDLWSGNIASVKGSPSIYDPACYYGHHEAEWGMSWCAGFGQGFWAGYRELVPESPRFKDRRPLYEAYHQLNHYNMFGGGYLGSTYRCLEQVKKALDK